MSSIGSKGPVRIASDIGGTFTDIQVFDARAGRVHTWKTPTTPDDPSRGLMIGINEAASRFDFVLSDVGLLLHGTTVATNAVLERKLARAVLVTTAGFEDVLEINRHVRRDIYGLSPEPPPTLIPRGRRFGVTERMRANGTVETELDEAALPALLARIEAAGAESVAVSFINAYANPAHEQAVAAWLARHRPDLPVSLSSVISPEIREFERTSTVALNALLVPVVKAYLDRLQARLGQDGFAPHLLLVQSNGGMCNLPTAVAAPARLLLSGPSGGVMAAERLAGALLMPNLVAVDMGGTSFDVSVVRKGTVSIVTQGEIDRLPVRLPMVDMRTIGSGGGSIASLEGGGRLTVGPRSAGADPGPICYGRGGQEPTVTDANLVLGRIGSASFLGGRMPLDDASARQAITERIATPLGLSPEQAAQGILDVTNAALGGAIRLALFEKGLDPRDFALLPFGGAGGLHAIDVAAEVGIPEVVFPPEPGTLSAFGILFSDLVHHLVRSQVVRADASGLEPISVAVAALRQDAEARLDRDGIPPDSRAVRIAADLRYVGQAFELTVPWDTLEAVDAPALARLVARFHALHKERYAYSNPADAVECVAVRGVAVGRIPKPEVAWSPDESASAAPEPRRVFTESAWRDVPAVSRASLAIGQTIVGPAVIQEAFATHWIAGGWRLTLDPTGALRARKEA